MNFAASIFSELPRQEAMIRYADGRHAPRPAIESDKDERKASLQCLDSYQLDPWRPRTSIATARDLDIVA